VESHQSRVDGQNHLPQPAGHASFDASQDMVGLLGCKHVARSRRVKLHCMSQLSFQSFTEGNRVSHFLIIKAKVVILSLEDAAEGGDQLSSFSALLHKAGQLFIDKYPGCHLIF